MLQGNAAGFGAGVEDCWDGEGGVDSWEEVPLAGEEGDDARGAAGLFPD